jgi:tetratricopeptide (TPR) repeat protein
VQGLRVAARTSAFSFKGKREDLRAVGDKLDVATVLEGSVRKAGNRLRVTAQLVTAADGYHLWSERFDRDLTDVFAVQDEIAAAIAEKLQVTYVRPAAADAGPATSSRVEAYELYLKGRSLLTRRGAGIREALVCFERAVALDAASAQAHAGLGETLWVLAYYGVAPQAETVVRARAVLSQALELDPDLGEALGTSALITFCADWDVAAARRQFERTLQAHPGLSEARCNYAMRVLTSLGESGDRVAAELNRAVADDPLSGLIHADTAIGLSWVGRIAEAVERARRAVDLDPHAFAGHLALAWTAALAEDYPLALAEAEAALQLSARHPWVLSIATGIHAGRGDSARAQAIHDELRARAISGSVPAQWLSLSALQLGRVDEAMDHAMRSAERRELVGPWMLSFPGIAPLRAHPRYPELLRKSGL